MIAPMFLFPVHPIPYVTNVIYVYYFGVMDHSGIKMESIYPWQPNTTFHDEHHRLAFSLFSRLFSIQLHGKAIIYIMFMATDNVQLSRHNVPS